MHYISVWPEDQGTAAEQSHSRGRSHLWRPQMHLQWTLLLRSCLCQFWWRLENFLFINTFPPTENSVSVKLIIGEFTQRKSHLWVSGAAGIMLIFSVIHNIYISSNISFSLRNFIIFFTSQFLPSTVLNIFKN